MHVSEQPVLSRAERFKTLSDKSILPWIRDIAIDWAVIGAAMTAAVTSGCVPVVLISMLVIGNRQHALAVLGHEGAHLTLCRDKRRNDLLANALALWPIGLTVSGYRKLHYQHHKATGTAHDPELHHKRSRNPQWDLPLRRRRVAKYLLADFVGGSVKDYRIIVTYSKPENKRDTIHLILFHMLVAAGLVACGLWPVAVLWYVSLPTTFMAFFRLRLWFEHQGTGDTNRIHLNWWQRHVLAPHNIWYHWEHHKYAHIPYYNLPKVRALDPGEEVITLGQLIKNLRHMPSTPSGFAFQEMI